MVARYFVVIKTENDIHIKILAPFSTFLIARNHTTGIAHNAKEKQNNLGNCYKTTGEWLEKSVPSSGLDSFALS